MRKFKFDDGSKVFFTSDTHFSHGNVMRFCHRPFRCTEEMDTAMVENWNRVVDDESIVFHLGDFAFGNLSRWEEIRSRLKGSIVLLLGNHDMRAFASGGSRFSALFEHVAQQMLIEVEHQKIYLNHYPLMCYAGTYGHRPIWQLFGHLHLNKYYANLDSTRAEYSFPLQYDVGVDLNGFTPLSFTQIKRIIDYQVENQVNVTQWLTEAPPL